jgi:hypothetical protein
VRSVWPVVVPSRPANAGRIMPVLAPADGNGDKSKVNTERTISAPTSACSGPAAPGVDALVSGSAA